MDCQGQLHHTQIRAEVPAGACDRVDEELPDLPGEKLAAPRREQTQVLRRTQSLQLAHAAPPISVTAALVHPTTGCPQP